MEKINKCDIDDNHDDADDNLNLESPTSELARLSPTKAHAKLLEILCASLQFSRSHPSQPLCPPNRSVRRESRTASLGRQLHSDDSFTRTTAIQARNEIFLSTSLFRSHTRCHIPVFPAVCPSTTAAFDASMLFDIMTPQTSAMLRVSELRESELLFGHPSRR